MDKHLSLADQLTNESVIGKEISRRSTNSSQLKTIYLPEGGLGKRADFFNNGTIVVIISKDNPEYINGLEKAIKSKNESMLDLFCDAIVERTRKDTMSPLKDRVIEDIPVIVDVLYGETWLAKHLMIAPHTELALSTSVWSGGKLNDKGFRVLQHIPKNGKEENIKILAILIPPKLSKIEKSVLDAVPKDLSDIHLNGPSVSWSAAGVGMKWTKKAHDLKPENAFSVFEKFFVPYREQEQFVGDVHQRQQQQEDTMQQQQQQQHNNQDAQHQNHQQHQQQQQQQQQADGQMQQQQQEQHQAEQTYQQQNQQQQQQQDGEVQQQNHYNEHHANTDQEAGGSDWLWNEFDGGFARPIDELQYVNRLSQIDFDSLDATQSVKELLRIREQLLTIGLK